MSTQRKLKEVEFEYQGLDGKSEVFVVREPTAEETNAADLIRSHAFFEAVDKGIRTETEILRRLKEQGRFNEDDYNIECNNLGVKLRDLMVSMSVAKNKEELSKLHGEARETREILMEKYRDKETFLQHSAEQKAENALHLALLGVCLEKKDGTPLFAVVKKDTQELDIEKTYYAIYNYDDHHFTTAALSYFMPLVMGVDREALREFSEDALFKERLSKLTGEEVTETPKAAPKEKNTVYSHNKEKKSTSVPAPPREKETENYEMGGDVASGESWNESQLSTFSLDEEPKVVATSSPDRSEENKPKEEPKEKPISEPIQPEKAPVAPQLPEPSKHEPDPFEEDEEEEMVPATANRNTEEEVIKVGADTGSIRSGNEDLVDRDGAARPFGMWKPPVSGS